MTSIARIAAAIIHRFMTWHLRREISALEREIEYHMCAEQRHRLAVTIYSEIRKIYLKEMDHGNR